MNSNSKKEKLNENLPKVEESSTMYKSKTDLEKENYIGYDIDGNEISEKVFVSDIQDALKLFQEGKLETISSVEVKRRILG
jgi:soluble cytochrome b562